MRRVLFNVTLPHELVKTVPLCCNCHCIVTNYLDKKFAQENGLDCENPSSVELPFGGTVNTPDKGIFRGGFE